MPVKQNNLEMLGNTRTSFRNMKLKKKASRIFGIEGLGLI
jgi:hypothetical protein